MSRVTAWANFASHLAHPASGSAVRAALLRFFVSDGFGHLLGRCGARFRAAYAVAENSACSRRVCEALCVSHQRSPLVLQGCQRAKRPCSCPNKTLGYRLQSVLGARSAGCEEIRFRELNLQNPQKLLAVEEPDPKTRFEAYERAGGSKSTKICRSQNPLNPGIL